MGRCCLRHIYLYVRDINKLARSALLTGCVHLSDCWSSRLPCVSPCLSACPADCLQYHALMRPVRKSCVGIWYHHHVPRQCGNAGMHLLQSLLLVGVCSFLFFFFLFHDRHVVLHFQPQTATAGVGPQGQMLHIHHGWHNSCQQTKYSRNKSAVAALGNRMVVGCPQAKTVGEILDSLKSIFCFLSYIG